MTIPRTELESSHIGLADLGEARVLEDGVAALAWGRNRGSHVITRPFPHFIHVVENITG
jgi:hypothetical protein